MLITIINILMSIISIVIVIIIFIIIVITIATKYYYYYYKCFISNKSTNCLGLSEIAVNKPLTVLALEIFKDNQNRAKVESNILLMRSTQQRK